MSETGYSPDLIKAIIEVKSHVKKLGKNDRNGFAGYDFAGIDKFIEAVNPLMSGAGLVIFMNEISNLIVMTEKTDKNGSVRKNSWLEVKYEFQLVHETGGMLPTPVVRSVMVPAEGAQAYGSAQSYALKQFMRCQFLIPTGGKEDADFREATELPPANERKSAYQARKEGKYPALQDSLRACKSKAQLEEWYAENKLTIEELPGNWTDMLRSEYGELYNQFSHMAEITQPEAAE